MEAIKEYDRIWENYCEYTGKLPQTFKVDAILADSNQIDVFRKAAQPLLDQVMEGCNGSIIAYGATGAEAPIYG